MSYFILDSSFCKNCDNFMDITNNISKTIETMEIIKQEGGYKNDSESYEINDLEGVHIESSDYDVSLSDSIGGANIDNDKKKDTILNLNINDLNKNEAFNKLTNKEKSLAINKIIETNTSSNTKTNTKLKTNKQPQSIKESYFYCKSCGYNEKIPNQQFIFSRGNEKDNKTYNYNFINLINDNTIPRTKNYNCINSNCSTHKNPKSKLAIFYRHSGSYNIRYICNICNNFWDTYSADKSKNK